MKRKNVSRKQLKEFIDPNSNEPEIKPKTNDDMEKIRLEADKKFRDIVNKLLLPDSENNLVNYQKIFSTVNYVKKLCN